MTEVRHNMRQGGAKKQQGAVRLCPLERANIGMRNGRFGNHSGHEYIHMALVISSSSSRGSDPLPASLRPNGGYPPPMLPLSLMKLLNVRPRITKASFKKGGQNFHENKNGVFDFLVCKLLLHPYPILDAKKTQPYIMAHSIYDP